MSASFRERNNSRFGIGVRALSDLGGGGGGAITFLPETFAEFPNA